MTPLIREMVAINPEASTDYMWFDATEVLVEDIPDLTDEVLALPMPFPLCAIALDDVGKDGDSVRTLLIVRDRLGARGVTGWSFFNGNHRKLPAFVYDLEKPLNADGTLQVKKVDRDEGPLTQQMIQVAANYLSLYLRSIHSPAPIPGYTPVDKQKFVNKKRIAKGKAPIYEWTTVVIEPPKPKAEPKGGTHASPRLHDRRGHYRKLRNGKLAWVKACKVGDASKGTVFKDYTWRANDAAPQAR